MRRTEAVLLPDCPPPPSLQLDVGRFAAALGGQTGPDRSRMDDPPHADRSWLSLPGPQHQQPLAVVRDFIAAAVVLFEKIDPGAMKFFTAPA